MPQHYCIVPGCKEKAIRLPQRGRPLYLCPKHHRARKSGRVGKNHARDIHNFHRKGYCEGCGVTPMQVFETYFEPQYLAAGREQELKGMRVRDKIKAAMVAFHGDHKNGRNVENANHAEQIQTFCSTCHIAKSTANNDYSGWR